MFSKRIFFTPARLLLLLTSALVLCPLAATAQRHGGGASPGAIPGGMSRPDGVDEKDSLQDFHHAMAVQATSEQIAEFQTLVKTTGEAKSKSQGFEQKSSKPDSGPDASITGAQLDQAIETSRAGNKKFLDGFSEDQKSGLKDLIKRMVKADSDLEAEEKKLDQSLQANAAGTDIGLRAESLDKALTEFSNEQLAIGREMDIILASGDDLTFAFMPVKSTAHIGSQTTAVTVSGMLSQIATEGGQRTFKLKMIADLLDLQQNVTQLLRPQIERGSDCGERLLLRQASIAPSTPLSVLVLQMHYERWSCRGSISSEIAEGDGSVEMKLTPTVEKPNVLKLAAVYSRIDASGMMGDSLRSGDLGDDLRDRVTQSILAAMQAGTDFKANLPPAVQSSAVLQSVKFQDAIAGRLTVVLDGQMEVSNDQVHLMASQLNQSLAAQGTASR
jgi:hypothetical protein